MPRQLLQTYKLTVNTTTGCSDFQNSCCNSNQTKPTVAVNAAQVITCANTVSLDGTGSATTGVTYAWSTADGTFSGATDALPLRQLLQPIN
jgi:hypothetical protein